MRAAGRSRGRRSRSQWTPFVAVQVRLRWPLRPCTATILGKGRSQSEAAFAKVRGMARRGHHVLNHGINTLGDDLKALRGLADSYDSRTRRWTGLRDRLIGRRRRVSRCRRRSIAGSERVQPRDERLARRGHGRCDLALGMGVPELQPCGFNTSVWHKISEERDLNGSLYGCFPVAVQFSKARYVSAQVSIENTPPRAPFHASYGWLASEGGLYQTRSDRIFERAKNRKPIVQATVPNRLGLKAALSELRGLSWSWCTTCDSSFSCRGGAWWRYIVVRSA